MRRSPRSNGGQKTGCHFLAMTRSVTYGSGLQWRQAGYVDSGFVFRQENGQPYHPDVVTQAFAKAVRESGQPRIRLHDLRHIHATLALQAGVHVKVVSERLGHANVGITLDLYSHAIPALEEAAAVKIASLFMPSEAAS